VTLISDYRNGPASFREIIHTVEMTQRGTLELDARQIVEKIMTMHWDLAACPCWICKVGNAVGCRPREEHLGWRNKFAYVRVEEQKSGQAQDGGDKTLALRSSHLLSLMIDQQQSVLADLYFSVTPDRELIRKEQIRYQELIEAHKEAIRAGR
jgi:hypothetical protein